VNVDENEQKLLRSAALKNAESILIARQRAERELLATKEELERTTEELRQGADVCSSLSPRGPLATGAGMPGRICSLSAHAPRTSSACPRRHLLREHRSRSTCRDMIASKQM